MSAEAEQRAILASEFYWFGGQLGTPKVFDAGTSFNAPPTLRGAHGDAVDGEDELLDGASRIARLVRTDGGWEFTLDEA